MSITLMILIASSIVVATLVGAYVFYEEYGGDSNPLSGFSVENLRLANSSNLTLITGLVYLAITPSQQAQGFQGVSSFGNCNAFATNSGECLGMIFVFSGEQNLCFWMLNTNIPLQQAWISSNGTIDSIYQAQPENQASVCHNAEYVLEASPQIALSLGDYVYESAL